MDKMYLILLFILSIFIIFLIYQNINIKEKFSVVGAQPNYDSSGWNIGFSITGDGVPNNNENNFEVGKRCRNSLGWGTYNPKGECIIGLSTGVSENVLDNLKDINNLKKLDELNSLKEAVQIASNTHNVGCIDKDQDFDTYCKKINPSYGVKSISECTDPNQYNIICGEGYINGKYYGKNIITTECLDKHQDFDTWCRYVSDKTNIPQGFNVNSVGSEALLVGDKGGCFLPNGTPDYNKARALCSFNNMEQLPKLQNSFTHYIDYNKFTKCMKHNSNFLNECKTVLEEQNTDQVVTADIMGYDCNPGYFRSKCYHKKDFKNIETNYRLTERNNIYKENNSKIPCNEDNCEKFQNQYISKKNNLNHHMFNINNENELFIDTTPPNTNNKLVNVDMESTTKSIETKIYNRLINNIENKINKIEEQNIGTPADPNIWKYSQTYNQWFSIPQNNLIGKWKNVKVNTNKTMSISFWINISSISNNDRNIFHVSNDNVNCCNSGNRVPGIWILEKSSTLLIVNDTDVSPNQSFTVDGISMAKDTFVTISWNNKDCYVYLNKKFIKSYTFPGNLIDAMMDAYVYIGDPWSEQNNGIKIKNLIIYNYVLTIEQINKIYDDQNIISGSWTYDLSINKWYTISTNNLIGTWDKLNIASNSNMTLAFTIMIIDLSTTWRNIFHVSNDNVDCCDKGNRVPGIWMYPNDTTLYICYDTENSPNNYIKLSNLKMNVPIHIYVVFNNNTINAYVNGKIQKTLTIDAPLVPAIPNAKVYIGDPWTLQNGGLKIKNFTIYNSALQEDQINKIHKTHENNS